MGDTTRSNLLTDGAFNSPAAWDAEAGWVVASGVAQHSAGAAGSIGQAMAATDGKWYRVSFSVAGRTAGSVLPKLTGGADRLGTVVASDGDYRDRIQAVAGTDAIAWAASSGFDGAIDNAVAYLETSACLATGTYYLWLEPWNADGVPGPLSGPFTLSIL